jgi:hypothetical protein
MIQYLYQKVVKIFKYRNLFQMIYSMYVKSIEQTDQCASSSIFMEAQRETQPGPLLNGSINFPDFFRLFFFLCLDEKFKISEKFIKPFQRYSLLRKRNRGTNHFLFFIIIMEIFEKQVP